MLRIWRRLPALISIMISFLLGCVKGRAQSATAEVPSPVVILRLKESLYKKDAKPGYSLEFEVGYDLVVNGQIGIQSGTAVIGTLRQVDHAAKGPPKLLID